MATATTFKTNATRRAQIERMFTGSASAPLLYPASAVVKVTKLLGDSSIQEAISGVAALPAAEVATAVLLVLSRGRVVKPETLTAPKLYLAPFGWSSVAVNDDGSIVSLTDGSITLSVAQYETILRNVSQQYHVLLTVGNNKAYLPAATVSPPYMLTATARVPLTGYLPHSALATLMVTRMDEWIVQQPDLIPLLVEFSHLCVRALNTSANVAAVTGIDTLFAPGLSFAAVVGIATNLINSAVPGTGPQSVASGILVLLGGRLTQTAKYNLVAAQRALGVTPSALHSAAQSLGFFLPVRPEAVSNYVNADGSALTTKLVNELLASDNVLLNKRECTGGQLNLLLGKGDVQVVVVPAVATQLFTLASGRKRSAGPGAAPLVSAGDAQSLFYTVGGDCVASLAAVVVLPAAPAVVGVAPVLAGVGDGGF